MADNSCLAARTIAAFSATCFAELGVGGCPGVGGFVGGDGKSSRVISVSFWIAAPEKDKTIHH